MVDSDRELGSVQNHLIKLSGEYRTLEELQLRQEKAIEIVTRKADEAHLKLSTIQEHIKAFQHTLDDFTIKINQMYVTAEKLKDEIHKIQIVLENIDGNRTRCADKFIDIMEEIEANEDNQKTVVMSIDTLKTKTSELEVAVNSLKESIQTMKDTLKPISDTHQSFAAIVKFFKIVGALTIAVLTIAGGAKALGLF